MRIPLFSALLTIAGFPAFAQETHAPTPAQLQHLSAGVEHMRGMLSRDDLDMIEICGEEWRTTQKAKELSEECGASHADARRLYLAVSRCEIVLKRGRALASSVKAISVGDARREMWWFRVDFEICRDEAKVYGFEEKLR